MWVRCAHVVTNGGPLWCTQIIAEESASQLQPHEGSLSPESLDSASITEEDQDECDKKSMENSEEEDMSQDEARGALVQDWQLLDGDDGWEAGDLLIEEADDALMLHSRQCGMKICVCVLAPVCLALCISR
jgi:hypothetical protein